jgi:MSHA biogenesis protein MshN
MSLLNDALRAAEQRQNRPEAPGAYTGQAATDGRRGPWLWVIVLLLMAGLVATSVYWFQIRNSDSGAPAVAASPSVVDPVPDTEQVAQPNEVPASVPEPSAEPASAPEPAPEIARTPEPAIAESSEPSAPVSTSAPAPASEPAPAPAPKPDKPAASAQSQPVADVKGPASEQGRADPETDGPEPQVKQVRETPEAIDLRVSRELASLIGAGETRKAEEKLAQLAAAKSAIASRKVFAREMLVQGQPDRALAWLPESSARSDAGLRLLRARALHARGDVVGAVATLEQDIPPAGQHLEYRITLATLLQQAGRSAEAARHWSVLIAQDDSRAAWWVGLAIALESGGEESGAVRAYSQAAKLPGLSPSLADYVRDRLKTLQAG